MMATRVSWGFADITISFDIGLKLLAEHRRAAVHTRARTAAGAAQEAALHPPRTATCEKVVALLNCTAQPMRPSFRTGFPARDYRGGSTAKLFTADLDG
jgi:hypothetical protein